jgi:hypothetical protein
VVTISRLKLQTSQGYIICILLHFATKLWNITNFVMLFQAVMKFLSRLVEFKILVNWGWSIELAVFIFDTLFAKIDREDREDLRFE